MSVTLSRPTLVNETTPGTGTDVNVALLTDIFDRIDTAFALLAPLASPSLVTPTLGAALATTINGNTLTTGTYTLTGAASKTLTFSNTLTLAGTDSTTMTFPSTSATIARTDAANTFAGHQTIEGVTSTGATGTGKFVFDGSPVLVTPTLGDAAFTKLTTSINSSSTQIFHNSNDNIEIYGNGSIRTTAGLILEFSVPLAWAAGFSSTGDLFVLRDGPNIHAWRNSTTAQKGRLYNSFTTVDTAGEWWKNDWQTTANQLRFGTVRGTSTGTARVASWDYGGLEASPVAAITVPITSGPITFGGPLAIPASTTSLASANLPHGSAPTSPVDGDLWTTSAGLYVRINGSTVGPLS